MLRRGTRRGPERGGSVPLLRAPAAISDLAAPAGVTIGGTLTFTAAPGSTSTQLYRDGVSSGTVTTGYVITAADLVSTTGTQPGAVLDVRGVNAAGTGPASNTLAWNPASLVEMFRIDKLTAGAIAALIGIKAGWSLVQATGAKQPVASQTSFNSRPGLFFDATAHSALAGPTNLSATASLRVIAAMLDAMTAVSIAMELTASVAATDGSFAIVPNDVAAGRVAIAARGTTNLGEISAVEALSAACVMSYGFNTALTSGGAFIRKDGVALSTATAVNTCGPGNLANSTLNIGGRNNGASLSWGGTYGPALMFLTGAAQDADLTDCEQYVKYLAGL